MGVMLRRLLCEEAGQDLIEYALLASLVGLAGIIVWGNIRTAIGTTYGAWDLGVQNASACTPDPGGGGC